MTLCEPILPSGQAGRLNRISSAHCAFQV